MTALLCPKCGKRCGALFDLMCFECHPTARWFQYGWWVSA